MLTNQTEYVCRVSSTTEEQKLVLPLPKTSFFSLGLLTLTLHFQDALSEKGLSLKQGLPNLSAKT